MATVLRSPKSSAANASCNCGGACRVRAAEASCWRLPSWASTLACGGSAVRIASFCFGSIQIDCQTYDHDVIIWGRVPDLPAPV